MEIQGTTLLEQVLVRLGSEKGNLRAIAVGAGVPYSTLMKLSARSVTDPRFSTVQALHNYFESHPTVRSGEQ
ncbi:hypothetical protein G5S35_03960 [Paraburkholderia tropica]|nr:hypothetical protein [Paraburkholderia tropica]QNB10104.1 hypothetical protein G5S35_03960 [Paraburkholderia tropica]